MNAVSASQGFSWHPGEMVFGGIWSLLLVDSVWRLIFTLPDSPVQTWIINSALLGGTVANALYWAGSVHIFSLGGWGELVKTIGFGTTSIIAFLEGVDASETLLGAWGVDSNKGWNLAFFSLGYRVTTLAWSILGICAFFVTSAALATTMNLLFLTSFLFFIAQYVYYGRLLRENGIQTLPS